jgi:transcription initiation factor IIE alpha subunit
LFYDRLQPIQVLRADQVKHHFNCIDADETVPTADKSGIRSSLEKIPDAHEKTLHRLTEEG